MAIREGFGELVRAVAVDGPGVCGAVPASLRAGGGIDESATPPHAASPAAAATRSDPHASCASFLVDQTERNCNRM